MKIMHFLPALNGGGVERVLLRYIRKSHEEGIGHNYTHSFIIHDKKQGLVELRMLEFGSDIYRVPRKYRNPVGFVISFWKALKLNRPDIIHLHQSYSSWMAVLLAKLNGCKTIVHGHSHRQNEGYLQRLHNKLSSCVIDYADVKLACSSESFQWLWRERVEEKSIIYNAFDFSDFKFSDHTRELTRDKLGIKKDIKVIGVIGRLTKQKNYPFIFEIMKNLPGDKYKLLIIGEGEEGNALKTLAKRLSLQNIIWLEPRESVSDVMCAMDVLLLPSLWEGLGIVALEGQINGLPVLISEHLPADLDLSPLLSRISVFKDNSVDLWVNKIRDLQINASRNLMINQMDYTPYNINFSWIKLFKIYDDIYKTSN